MPTTDVGQDAAVQCDALHAEVIWRSANLAELQSRHPHNTYSAAQQLIGFQKLLVSLGGHARRACP